MLGRSRALHRRLLSVFAPGEVPLLLLAHDAQQCTCDVRTRLRGCPLASHRLADWIIHWLVDWGEQKVRLPEASWSLDSLGLHAAPTEAIVTEKDVRDKGQLSCCGWLLPIFWGPNADSGAEIAGGEPGEGVVPESAAGQRDAEGRCQPQHDAGEHADAQGEE